MMVGVALNRHPLARFAVLAVAHVGGGAGAHVADGFDLFPGHCG